MFQGALVYRKLFCQRFRTGFGGQQGRLRAPLFVEEDEFGLFRFKFSAQYDNPLLEGRAFAGQFTLALGGLLLGGQPFR